MPILGWPAQPRAKRHDLPKSMPSHAKLSRRPKRRGEQTRTGDRTQEESKAGGHSNLDTLGKSDAETRNCTSGATRTTDKRTETKNPTRKPTGQPDADRDRTHEGHEPGSRRASTPERNPDQAASEPTRRGGRQPEGMGAGSAGRPEADRAGRGGDPRTPPRPTRERRGRRKTRKHKRAKEQTTTEKKERGGKGTTRHKKRREHHTVQRNEPHSRKHTWHRSAHVDCIVKLGGSRMAPHQLPESLSDGFQSCRPATGAAMSA